MEKIRKEQLEGFRNPSQREKQEILPCLKKTFQGRKRSIRMIKIWISCIFAAALMAVLDDMKYPYENGRMLFIHSVFAIVLGGTLIFLNKWRVENRILLENAVQGEFFVLDCMIYEADTSTDKAQTGAVYVCTRDGQYCWDRFRVDLQTVLNYQQGKHDRLLLVKCSSLGKGTDYFEIFTEEKLRSGR